MQLNDLRVRTEAARQAGQETIIVVGLGFVGTAVAANLARVEGPDGRKKFFVIGLDQDTPQGREKCAALNRGEPPTYANDPALEHVIAAAAVEPKALVGTTDPQAIAFGDVVVSCINLDLQRESGQTERLECRTDGYAAAMRMIGRHMRPGALVCVESTLPLGMSDTVLYPALKDGLRLQGVDPEREAPLLAYCYERVMPGPTYLDSVNNFWRAFAGIDERSADHAEAFLGKYVNVAQYPLWRHKTIRAAEMGKLLENAYRATNIAFIEEWSKLAERVEVDLFDVVNSIRLRKGTHDNMMFPGLGVGGYCLTKDALLAVYGAENLLKVEAEMPFSRRAILTNERMPLRAVEMVRAHFGGHLANRTACLVGVTYRPGVADTRSSPAEVVARALIAEGVDIVAHDTLVSRWEELPELKMEKDGDAALKGRDIVIVCLPDGDYKKWLPAALANSLNPGSIVVDPWNVVASTPGLAARLAATGVELRVYGRGDVSAAEV